jgi:hypothetical protein
MLTRMDTGTPHMKLAHFCERFQPGIDEVRFRKADNALKNL